jgi:hypothetical protein
MFEGQIETSEGQHLLYVTRHYHVIWNLTVAMAKKCVKLAVRGVVAVSLLRFVM